MNYFNTNLCGFFHRGGVWKIILPYKVAVVASSYKEPSMKEVENEEQEELTKCSPNETVIEANEGDHRNPKESLDTKKASLSW